MKSLIQKLVEATGPSGYESQVRELIRTEIEAYADDIQTDKLGNLIVRKGTNQADGLKIMLSAHMDEIGLIVTHIDENGFLRFTNLGGVRGYNHIGGRVRFLNGTSGVIGMERMSDRSRMPALDNLYIDVGAASPKDCPVKVGDVAAFERPFMVLSNQQGRERLVSKAMDDRISVAILIEALRRLGKTPHELYFVFSVQEEVGVRGATTAAYGVDPDLGLAVDVTLTGDTPKALKMEVALGNGPAIKVRDSGMLADPRVVDWMVTTAEQAKIPYQMEILVGGSTDARAIQLSRAGVPAGCLSIPCRYVHSPSEMVDLQDVENAVKLLLELISKPVKLG
jgi:putative aminopeptidase FrvX